MRKVIQIAIAQFKTLFRNFKANAIMFILPVAFMGIFSLAFGSSSEDITYKVALVKSKSDAYDIVKNDVMEATELFEIIEFNDYDLAHTSLEEDKVNAIIEVPDDYYPGVYSDPVTITGKPTSQNFGAITSILRNLLGSYLNIENNYIETEYTTEGNQEDYSAFDYIAPGMMVYGILILLPNVANNFVSIVERKYIFRYFTSKTKSWEIILGNTIYQMVVAIINIILLYGSAVAFGFSAQGNILYGLIIGIPTALFVVGLGMLIGAFSKQTEAATNTGTLFSVILGFLSGSFISGIGQLWEIELFGNTFQFNDFLPSKWATTALEKVLRDGKDLSSITTELIVITTSSIVILAIGIVVYYRKHLRSLE